MSFVQEFQKHFWDLKGVEGFMSSIQSGTDPAEIVTAIQQGMKVAGPSAVRGGAGRAAPAAGSEQLDPIGCPPPPHTQAPTQHAALLPPQWPSIAAATRKVLTAAGLTLGGYLICDYASQGSVCPAL